MTKLKSTFIYLIIFLMPLLIISVFVGRDFNISSVIYGLESLEIVEDFNDLKELVKFNDLQLDWTFDLSWDSLEKLVSNIFDIFKIIIQVIHVSFQVFVIDPVLTIIDIFNLLYGG